MWLIVPIVALTSSLTPVSASPALGQSKALVPGETLVSAQAVRDTTPLDARALANVTAWARLYGYVRFFHPDERSATANWDSIAVEGMRSVEHAPAADSLARTLRRVLAVAPDVQLFTNERPEQCRVAAQAGAPDAAGILHWRHEGVRTWPVEAEWQKVYRSGLAVVPASAARAGVVPDPNAPLRVDLGGGVTACVPLARFVPLAGDTTQWTPVVMPPDTTYSAEERSVRLAAAAILWNVIQHFYPYFDAVDAAWPPALERALRSAATDATPHAFERTLRGVLADAHDGHGWADLLPYAYGGGVPLRTAWVEDRLVVTAVHDSVAHRVRVGDVVLALNGRETESAFEALRPYVPGATEGWVRFRATLPAGPPDSSLTLLLRDGRAPAAPTRELTFVRTHVGALTELRPAPVAELRSGLSYVDITRATDADIDAALAQLVAARGIIFDLRGYPRFDARRILGHLTDRSVHMALMPGEGIPLIHWPDRHRMTFPYTDTTFRIEPRLPRFTSNVAFLTDERAISFSESLLEVVDEFRLGDIVGSPTAGTNGTNNPFIVPGGYRVTWTGMRVLKHDGSHLHGIGILPTVPVVRTVRGVAEGRDEVLERAILVLQDAMRREDRPGIPAR